MLCQYAIVLISSVHAFMGFYVSDVLVPNHCRVCAEGHDCRTKADYALTFPSSVDTRTDEEENGDKKSVGEGEVVPPACEDSSGEY